MRELVVPQTGTGSDGEFSGLVIAQPGTNPENDDSDGDGLSDGAEDQNGNGRLDEGETSPLVAGTTNGNGNGDGTSNWVLILIAVLVAIVFFVLVRLIRWLLNR